jgi:glycerol uptake facilitator protein
VSSSSKAGIPADIAPAAVDTAEAPAITALSPLRFAMGAELLGTFVLVFFGVGAVNAAVITGAQSGLWQVAVVWAVGVSLGIYASAATSGAHLNPAITLAAVVYDRFPPLRGLAYWIAQLAGAALASVALYAMFDEAIIEFERNHGLLRGGPGSELSAMVFGEYFPNPAIFGTAENAWRIVSLKSAFVAEMIGTAMLALLISVITHPRNEGRPAPAAAAVMIGLSVAAIISVIAPLTQAGLNPARDLGPRLVSYFLGWGDIAIPGPRGGWLTVYVLAPMVGALVGRGIGRLAMNRLTASPRSGAL